MRCGQGVNKAVPSWVLSASRLHTFIFQLGVSHGSLVGCLVWGSKYTDIRRPLCRDTEGCTVHVSMIYEGETTFSLG